MTVSRDPALYEAIVDGLETCLLVVDRACRRVLCANASAATLLRAFGASGATLPRALVVVLSAMLAADPPGARFRGSLAVSTPRGERYYARAKLLDARGTMLLIVLSEHVVRDRDLGESLRARFEISARDIAVVKLLRAGLSNSEIAARLGLTEGTVKNYVSRIFTTLGARSRTQLLVLLRSLAAEGS